MGHEMVGEIAELGDGLTTDTTGKTLAVGDRVVTPYFWTCGRCHACARGRSYACQNLMAGEFRTHEQSPHFVAAHGEYYYTTRRQPLYKVPDELPDEAVAPLNCALAEVLFALRDVRLGDTVVIQGAGGLGINAAAVARTAGAAQVIVIGKIAERLNVAADFGATHCINAEGISSSEVTDRCTSTPTESAPIGCSRSSVCRASFPTGSGSSTTAARCSRSATSGWDVPSSSTRARWSTATSPSAA